MLRINHTILSAFACFLILACNTVGVKNTRTYHVSITGSDTNNGMKATPLKTIFSAADKAQPGDTIMVHEGVYRERINPPRGGASDDSRIVYQAAPGENVVIKGSEPVTGWKKVEKDTWMVTLPNSFFGDFNPYKDVIHGDWYEAKQPYHTGAVYVNGHWLKEAAVRSKVVESEARKTNNGAAQDLVNVELLFLQNAVTDPIPASSFSSSNRKIKVTALADNKDYIGMIKDGDWVAYDIDFGTESTYISIQTASPECETLIDIRKDSPEGELLGTCETGITAEWTHFQPYRTLIKKLSGKQKIVLIFKSKPVVKTTDESDEGYWFSKVNEDTTTIWAQFKGVNPNQALVEINVRQTVFYPEKTGINYITVQGFTLEHAATPWSPPTAEQIGLIGTHWSKGWIIQENTIRYSACSGISLGKHGDEFDNTYSYHETIRRALENGWNRDTIGHHIVKNNHILNCGQTGIVGSLGAAFSTITGNEIHEIRQYHKYGGCETAGIKLHGAVDVVISDNHIYRCEHWGGLWLDWMAQGARITGNLFHDNSNDLMLEVNHGPLLVDNNIFLSTRGLVDASGGSAYAHNLWCGQFSIWPELAMRLTPFFKPHTTDILDKLSVNQHDDRFYNNMFANQKVVVEQSDSVIDNSDPYYTLFTNQQGLAVYDEYDFAITAFGNVFTHGAKSSSQDKEAVVANDFKSEIRLLKKSDGWWMEMNSDPTLQNGPNRNLVTSELLGKAQVPNAPFEQPDGTSYRIDTDYFGKQRDVNNPEPGPFRTVKDDKVSLKVWPKNN